MDNTEELYWIMFDVEVGTPEEQVVRARELLMLPTVDVNYKTERGDFSDDLGVGDGFTGEGKTALMNAVSSGRIDLVKLLLETKGQTGLDLDLQDEDGMTALMYAAFLDEPIMVMGLIKNGANLDKTIRLGPDKNWTALDLAIKTKESGVEVNPRPWRKEADSFLNTIYILENAMLAEANEANREQKRKQSIKNMIRALSSSRRVHAYLPSRIAPFVDGEDTPPTVEQMEAWKDQLKNVNKGTKEERKENAGKIKRKGTKKIKRRTKRQHRKTRVR